MSNQPVVFNIQYTPYKLPKNATEIELAAHKEEREFYNMTGGKNIYSYLTQRQKVGETADFLNYLEKTSKVFNLNGQIENDEIEEMQKRLERNRGMLWHGFLSVCEEDSAKIATPEKCLELIKRVFGPFFDDIKLPRKNIDLMCALHTDKPHHYHIHFLFWEKEPIYRSDKGELKYRGKGMISKRAIDNVIVRTGIFLSSEKDSLKETRQSAIKALREITGVKRAMNSRKKIEKDILSLAKEIPQDKSLGYAHEKMKPYRERVDRIVDMLIDYDRDAKKANAKFYNELQKRQMLIEDICGKPYAFCNQNQRIEDIESKGKYNAKIDAEKIEIVKGIEQDYRRRQGNMVINLARFIKPEFYERKGKHKANDTKLKRNLGMSRKKIKARLNKFISSIGRNYGLLEREYSKRLQEIEDEIRKEQEKETREAKLKLE